MSDEKKWTWINTVFLVCGGIVRLTQLFLSPAINIKYTLKPLYNRNLKI
jgi:hypothetical protein